MSESAKVDSIDSLKTFRTHLFKFQEAANVALSDAESEMSRLLMWVQLEQVTYWQGQIRKRHDHVNRCAEAVRMKQLYKDSTGRTQSAVDEMKLLQKAKKAYEEAETKFAACKYWSKKLEREIQNYRGSVQRFATTVQSDLPVAAGKLQGAILKLEQYVALSAPSEAGSAGGTEGSSSTSPPVFTDDQPSIARPAAEEPALAQPDPGGPSDHAENAPSDQAKSTDRA